ncbi:hypothetical protein Anapl_15945 [Anas platyrhynchos]|uniref:Uncharacterized protein n=1 Tax=Anas platyrhynchos TaxID=8839 RepID=R0KMY3_ANAPL|nr:hypothetical protein Anapl_15945 [Anas platyrhynchos]
MATLHANSDTGPGLAVISNRLGPSPALCARKPSPLSLCTSPSIPVTLVPVRTQLAWMRRQCHLLGPQNGVLYTDVRLGDPRALQQLHPQAEQVQGTRGNSPNAPRDLGSRWQLQVPVISPAGLPGTFLGCGVLQERFPMAGSVHRGLDAEQGPGAGRAGGKLLHPGRDARCAAPCTKLPGGSSNSPKVTVCSRAEAHAEVCCQPSGPFESTNSVGMNSVGAVCQDPRPRCPPHGAQHKATHCLTQFPFFWEEDALLDVLVFPAAIPARLRRAMPPELPDATTALRGLSEPGTPSVPLGLKKPPLKEALAAIPGPGRPKPLGVERHKPRRADTMDNESQYSGYSYKSGHSRSSRKHRRHGPISKRSTEPVPPVLPEPLEAARTLLQCPSKALERQPGNTDPSCGGGQHLSAPPASSKPPAWGLFRCSDKTKSRGKQHAQEEASTGAASVWKTDGKVHVLLSTSSAGDDADLGTASSPSIPTSPGPCGDEPGLCSLCSHHHPVKHLGELLCSAQLCLEAA